MTRMSASSASDWYLSWARQPSFFQRATDMGTVWPTATGNTRLGLARTVLGDIEGRVPEGMAQGFSVHTDLVRHESSPFIELEGAAVFQDGIALAQFFARTVLQLLARIIGPAVLGGIKSALGQGIGTAKEDAKSVRHN